MSKWHEELSGGGNYISTAIGTDVVLEVKAINKVTNKPDFEPKQKDGTRQGFLFEFVGNEGVVSVGTFALQARLKEADVDVGDTIRISHPNAGEYFVEKIS